ncbi:MAG: imidazole glycerol phosphate synthase subunit HisH [Bacteroidota bacterium]
MIAIINYEAGNLASVANAFQRLEEPYVITNDTNELDNATGVIFPGVGHAQPAMQSLQKNGLDSWLKQTQKPVLGICLGMQLFFESSEEGNSKGLGIIPGRLKKFDSSKAKVPHMGWNTFTEVSNHPIAENLSDREYFYYVHSFYAPVNDCTIASCNYIDEFSAIVARDNFIGVQFHPEKSGKVGSLLLQNFLQLVDKK